MIDTDKPVVLVFRSHLLARSETFVQAQCESLERHTGRYVGLWRDKKGLALSPDRITLLSAGHRLRFLLRPSNTDVLRLEQLKPRLIHAHFATDAVLARPLARALGVPLIVTFHGFDITVRPEVFRRGALGFGMNQLYPIRLMKLFSDPNVFYLAVSNYIRDKAIERGCPADRIDVHHIGVDGAKFTDATPVTLSARGKRILFVGRLVEKKGCRFLIEALRRLSTSEPDQQLHVVGDGPLREELQRQASASGVKTVFLGGQGLDVVRKEMQQARVLCVPSVIAENGDAEGFGMVFVEAQCMGLPVVSFASGGIVDAVEHGVTGLLAEERNIDELAHHLQTVLNDDDVWNRLALMGPARVAKHFSLQHQSRVLEQHYDVCIDRFDERHK